MGSGTPPCPPRSNGRLGTPRPPNTVKVRSLASEVEPISRRELKDEPFSHASGLPSPVGEGYTHAFDGDDDIIDGEVAEHRLRPPQILS